MVEIKEAPTAVPANRVSELETLVGELVERVDKLEKARENKGLKDVRDRMEDICDYLYGTNIRPPLTVREEGVYAAEVKPSNTDD